MKDLIRELEVLSEGRLDDESKIKALLLATEKAGVFISRTFSVKDHEVAIFLISTRQRVLKFLYPKPLRESGSIPVAGRVGTKDSIALRAINMKRGEIVNSAKNVKHLAIFELVKYMDKPPAPIQKMMCMPIISGDKAIGVIEVSRKGESEVASGADFEDSDLRKLGEIATQLAPYIVKLVPQNF